MDIAITYPMPDFTELIEAASLSLLGSQYWLTPSCL
jgi:hypothetical protein